MLNAISNERLQTYRLLPTDTNEDLIERYLKNIQLSQALYPILALFEITLRNSLYNVIDKHIKPNWLMEELSSQMILFKEEYKLLKKAEDKLTAPVYKQKSKTSPSLTPGKIIAELNFGFWVYLCHKKYNPNIWMKKPVIFDEVFPNFNTLMFNKNPDFKKHNRINIISKKLKTILILRNRIFHHEPIFNHSAGLLNCYYDIKELLMCMSENAHEHLLKICTFLECHNKILNKSKNLGNYANAGRNT